ncbi:DUF1704 domain-containing protein [Candidatus Saccharibacteria bacterium]|nr:DUF1704 domain-containing protein [Candidatus Saccharibacteria bacterium]
MGEKLDLHATNPSREELLKYENIPSELEEFNYFDDSLKKREAEKEDFLEGKSYLPNYDYPRLSRLYDGFMTGNMRPMTHEKEYENLLNMKGQIYKAVQELEIAAENEDINSAEYKLYADFQERRYMQILLVEEAEKLRMNNSTENRTKFMETNQRLFGAFNPEYFRDILDGTNTRIFDSEMIGNLGDIVKERYRAELSTVPDTTDDVYYDAQQVADTMNQAFQADGLAEKGWTAEIHPTKTIVAVNKVDKKLYLPRNTRRNASELKRLMVHEIGTHAIRAENGLETGQKILEFGTANYADAEEGLGVIMECAVAGNFDNASIDRAEERYIVAGFALGADGKTPRDARNTFEISWPIIAQRLAKGGEITDKIRETARTRTYNHIENAFRGTDMYMQGIIYSKLQIYYEGLVDNMKYFSGHADDLEGALDRAMIGKYNHTSNDEYHTIEKLLNG